MDSASTKVWLLCTMEEICYHLTTLRIYRARNSTHWHKSSLFPFRYYFWCFEPVVQYCGCPWKLTLMKDCLIGSPTTFFFFFLIYAIKLYIIYILFPFKFNTRHGNIFLCYRYFSKNLWAVWFKSHGQQPKAIFDHVKCFINSSMCAVLLESH